MAEENHTDYDCFVCFILSHGCENEIIYGVDGQLKLYDLIEKVKGSNCPSLIGKPKLFFVQVNILLQIVITFFMPHRNDI